MVSLVAESQSETNKAIEPILKLREDFASAEKAINALDAKRLTSNVPMMETAFKAIFGANSDPVSYKQRFLDQNAFLVYYTKGFDGPGRPSIENDLPIRQTLQFGARNEAWIAWDDAKAEIEFQIKSSEKENIEEVAKCLHRVVAAIDQYISSCSAPK